MSDATPPPPPPGPGPGIPPPPVTPPPPGPPASAAPPAAAPPPSEAGGAPPLDASGVPQAGDARLADIAAGKVFTSDLSVNEFVLVQEAGFEPLSMVVGSSMFHVGIQIGRWKQSMELDVLTQAMYHGRTNAMSRMLAEATKVGADGVVGMRLELVMYEGGQDVLEFMAVGTAVRASANPGAYLAPNGQPFTSDLSGQDFFTLVRGGHLPVSFVFGTCVYHVAHQGMMQSMRQIGQNVEMPQYTQAIYDARELAMGRMQYEVERDGAAGAVGVRLEVKNHVWGEHATEFISMGTAVRPLGGAAATATPTFVLPLSDT